MLFSQKITLFFVLCLFVIIVGTPVGIYDSLRDSMRAIGGAYLLMAVGVALVALLLDRFAVRYANALPVSIVEGVLLLGSIGWYQFGTRTTTVDLSGNPSSYFAIVWTNRAQLAEKPAYRFPFDKVIRVSDRTFVCLDQKEFLHQEFVLPDHWQNGFRSFGENLNRPGYNAIYVYQSSASPDYSDEQQARIKRHILAKLPRPE